MSFRTFGQKVVFWGALALCVEAALPAVAHAQRGGLRETFNIRYHPGRGRQTLDVFAPAGRPQAELAPVVVFVHGGSWVAGDKNFFGQYRSVGRYLAGQGLVAVLINYRLSPRVKHPEHAKDVARAFAWARRNVRGYGGDPDRIVLCGHSAGGHLVSLIATDTTYLNDPALKLDARDRSALRGVISVCGVYSIPGPDEFKGMVEQLVNWWMGERMGRVGRITRAGATRTGAMLNPFRVAFGNDAEVRKQASPLTHVRKGLPPFLLLYAESEVPGLREMADDFSKALRKVGSSVELREIDGCSHRNILFHLSKPGDPTAKALLEFVRKHTDRKVS
jgi:acetyl esterase/lipase